MDRFMTRWLNDYPPTDDDDNDHIPCWDSEWKARQPAAQPPAESVPAFYSSTTLVDRHIDEPACHCDLQSSEPVESVRDTSPLKNGKTECERLEPPLSLGTSVEATTVVRMPLDRVIYPVMTERALRSQLFMLPDSEIEEQVKKYFNNRPKC